MKKHSKWSLVEATLATLQEGIEKDEYLDEVATHWLSCGDIDSESVLVKSFPHAKSDLTCKSLALAIGVCGVTGAASVDSLTTSYETTRQHSFLGPVMLDALFLLANRDDLAKAELSTILQRVSMDDDYFLASKAATTCGRLLQQGLCPELEGKLNVLSEHQDPAVASEALFQLGCLYLDGIVVAANGRSLTESINKAATTFRLANSLQESRPEALLMSSILELFRSVGDRESTKAIQASIISARIEWERNGLWSDYLTPNHSVLLACGWNVIDNVETATNAMDESHQWLDIRDELHNLAATITSLRRCNFGDGFTRLTPKIVELTTSLVFPQIGTELSLAIGRTRVKAALAERGEAKPGDHVSDGLQLLLDLMDAGASDPEVFNRQNLHCIRSVAKYANLEPDQLLKGMQVAVQTGEVASWAEGTFPGSVALPIHAGTFYGNDPTVHLSTCKLLEQLRASVGKCDKMVWVRLVSVVVRVIGFVHFVRDDLPMYCLCKEDGGMGQTAGEDNLRDDLFKDLRREFGSSGSLESGPTGGGRTDTGVRFVEAEFPIECKAEFQHVDRAHIRMNYIKQPSDYASVRQQVSLLMVLDLRKQNAAGHRDHQKKSAKSKNTQSPVSLYSLPDSFWIESIPADPDIDTAIPSVVIVGLIPGNRPKPSSQTKYSQRPKAARTKRV